MPDVFLSHSSKDKEFVRELYRRLTRDGVDCFFDEESIEVGDNFVRALELGIDQCKYVVYVLSPDFCNSEWVEVERTSSLADDPAGLRRKAIPLMLRDCRHLATFPRFLKQVQSLDVSDGAFDGSYRKLCQKLRVTPVAEVTTLDRTKLPPVLPLPERHRMPYPSLHDKFVGRAEVLWQIYDTLNRGSTAVVQGTGVLAATGGMGKSQTAIEYVHRFGAGYPGGAYWLNADQGLLTVITQLSESAGVAIDTKAEPPVQAQQLWAGLNRMRPSLVVLDNFPEEISFQPYQPTTGRVHTLITTRRRDLDRFPHVSLDPLPADSGMELLNSGARQLTYAEAAPLVKQLGGLPLALELTKAFLNHRRELSAAQVLELIRSRGEMHSLREFAKRYHNELPSGHDLDIARTFQMSWDLASLAGQRVLRAMAELAPVPVPREPLRRMAGFDEAAGFEDEFAESIAELARLSLVELDRRGNPALHRLVRAFVRYRNEVDEVASLLDAVAKGILEDMLMADVAADARTLGDLELLLPHAEEFLADLPLDLDYSIVLASRIGIHHQAKGRLSTAAHFLLRALQLAEQTHESSHPSITSSQSNLATVLHSLGHLKEARDLLEKAVITEEAIYDAAHPSLAVKRSNLALVLKDMGCFKEALELLKETLTANKAIYERGHPSIATAQSNLATVLIDLGQLEEARDLLREALAANEATYEPAHPFIANVQSNLAMVLGDLGQLEEARDLLSKALDASEATYGPQHPSVARAQSNLAVLLRELDQHQAALQLLEQALATNQAVYESGHPSVATNQSNMALVLKDLGQMDRARDLLEQALAASEATYPAGHAQVMRNQSNLATVLQDLGRPQDARDLLEKALAAAEATFEAGHPLIAVAQSNLATVLHDLGELEEAKDLSEKALAADEATYGGGHPLIATRQSNLALVLHGLGQLERARELLEQARAAMVKSLGPIHPNTAIVRGNLAAVLEELGRPDEARALRAIASGQSPTP